MIVLSVKPETDGFIDKLKTGRTNWITLKIGEWIVTATIGAMVNSALGKIGDLLGVEIDEIVITFAKIQNIDLSTIDNTISRLVYTVVLHKIDGVFARLLLNNFLILSLFLLVPIAEIGFYKLYWVKRSARSAIE